MNDDEEKKKDSSSPKESDSEEDFMSDKFLTVDENLKTKKILTHKQKIENNKIKLEQSSRKLDKKELLDMTKKALVIICLRPGATLGKSQQGLIEPLKINLEQQKRKGLGSTSKVAIENLKRKFNRMDEVETPKLEEEQLKEFLKRKNHINLIKLDEIDVKKARNVCKLLDMQYDVERNLFWEIERKERLIDDNIGKVVVNDIDEFAENYDTSTQIQMIASYLKETHFYCMWCGEKFKNLEEFAEICPGQTREDHDL
ncbi:G patch domain-containing protein 11 [Lobulomyces angularis]|nr:G patch domain-containing protein 11 [Lobulomyces angularis]